MTRITFTPAGSDTPIHLSEASFAIQKLANADAKPIASVRSAHFEMTHKLESADVDRLKDWILRMHIDAVSRAIPVDGPMGKPLAEWFRGKLGANS